MTSAEQTALNERTTVPLTWVVGIVLTLLTGCGTVLGAYTWLDNQFDSMNAKLTAVEGKLDAQRRDRWSRSDMLAWSQALKQGNPDLTLPTLPAAAADED